eukprot:CAMPEP_0116919162 /NCGR_PEP_ID=MMETSP0467-20121206/20213_1 /TAXON_ID=283647 /ORGANISM="Mesodinium pulex, Strain SPMC105" /LENGTH=128 /DNA_ID=CAMNT_0004596671 /DNA_START=274 /DNA_END=660 /DNA_ORIENTATION=-
MTNVDRDHGNGNGSGIVDANNYSTPQIGEENKFVTALDTASKTFNTDKDMQFERIDEVTENLENLDNNDNYKTNTLLTSDNKETHGVSFGGTLDPTLVQNELIASTNDISESITNNHNSNSIKSLNDQ